MTTISNSTPSTVTQLLGATTSNPSGANALNDVSQALGTPTTASGSGSTTSTTADQLGLSSEVLSLLQGVPGADMMSALLGGASSSPMDALLTGSESAALVASAYAATAQKARESATSVDPVSNLVAETNAALNQANASPTDVSA